MLEWFERWTTAQTRVLRYDSLAVPSLRYEPPVASGVFGRANFFQSCCCDSICLR